MRSQCIRNQASNPGHAALLAWLDAHMPEAIHHPAARDDLMPDLIYTVTVLMTDEDWRNYNNALEYFPLALELQNLLAAGKESLDQVTYAMVNSEGNLTRPLLAGQGQGLEDILVVMVKKNRLGIQWDWARCGHRPELVPEEYGGTLKGYKG
jgi:hypothetical protein